MYKFHNISKQQQAREQGWLQLAPEDWSAGVFIGLHGCLGLVDDEPPAPISNCRQVDPISFGPLAAEQTNHTHKHTERQRRFPNNTAAAVTLCYKKSH